MDVYRYLNNAGVTTFCAYIHLLCFITSDICHCTFYIPVNDLNAYQGKKRSISSHSEIITNESTQYKYSAATCIFRTLDFPQRLNNFYKV